MFIFAQNMMQHLNDVHFQPAFILIHLILYLSHTQSLMKSQLKNKNGLQKKNMNITSHVVETLKAVNKKSNWKSKTTKMTKTLTGKTIAQKPNIMTQDDIEKLFRNNSKQKQSQLIPTKVSTQVGEVFGTFEHRDFLSSVKFLRIDDQVDRFLSGLPPSREFDENRILQLFDGHQMEDLTTKFKNNYLVGKVIGEGAYATVRVAIYKPKQLKVALKIYEKAKIKDIQRKKSVRRQIKILQLLHHPNIVKIHDVVQTNNHLNISMQYLSGLSLGTYLKAQPNGRISQKTCKKLFKQLAMALNYMHALNIAHRDIKLQNIILDEDLSPKLIDFGFSTCIEPNQKLKIFCGTPSYMAPEVVQRKQYRGQTADVWALGVLLFVSLTGIFPFKGSTDQELFKKIGDADYPKAQLLCSKYALDLIAKMLRVNSEQRITASQILCHSWFAWAKSDSIKKRPTETSCEGRKRVYTINSNFDHQILEKAKSKQKQQYDRFNCQKSNKKILAQTCKQNLNLQLRMALKSPTNKQIASFRKKKDDKQNIKMSFKHEKTHQGHQTGLIKHTLHKQNIRQTDLIKKKQKLLKTQPKVIQLLRMQLKKRQNQKSKSKSNTHRNQAN